MGNASRKMVPSVGMLPPTPVPSKKRQEHSRGKLGEKEESMPKTAVTRRVILKAFLRPKASASVQKWAGSSCGQVKPIEAKP